MMTQENIPYTADEIKAMVKTCEKYNKALERASKLRVQNPFDTVGQMVEHIFPELQESEDERIRKDIISYLRNEKIVKRYISDIEIDKWIAWIEKQGEQKSILDFKASDWYVSKVDGKIHNMYHSDDKVEPKFNVDDWVVQENIGTYKVIEVCESWYEVIDNQNNHYSIGFDKEDMCHLWTIQDAKDGDVLVTTKTRNCPFIYRKTSYKNNLAYYYVGIDGDGDLAHAYPKKMLHHFGPTSNVIPATKEQRDILFARIKKAGYEWDSEKKELKKIEPKTLNANKVVEWLDEHVPTKFEDMQNYVNQFKKDFEI